MADQPTLLALGGNPFAEAPSDKRVQYRYVEKIGAYERSQDAGKTWVTPQNLIENLRPRQFAAKKKAPPDSRIAFALAAIHPSLPFVIFSTIRISTTSNGVDTPPSPVDLGLYRSDGGEHWTKLTESVAFRSPIGIDPSNPAVMFGYGKLGLVGVLKTVDGGKVWALTKEQQLMEQRPSLKGEQHGSQILGFADGNLVYEFAIDPTDSNIVYVVSTKGIYRSVNGGDTWCLLNIGIDFIDSTYSLAFDPANSSVIIIGTRFGVLYSQNRGTDFTRIYPMHR